MMRVMLLLLPNLLLLACTAPSDSDETEACTLGDVTVTGEPAPGATVTLSASAEAAWTVSHGTLSSVTGAEVEWTLPTVDDDAGISATATATGCADDQTADVQIDVQWTLAQRSVILYNPSIEGSEGVATYYGAFRGIDQLCAVPSADSTTLAGADYPVWQATVQACLDAIGPHVQYIVPVYGVPYKVSDRIVDLFYGTPVTTSLDALLSAGPASLAASEVVEHPLYREGDSMTEEYVTTLPSARCSSASTSAAARPGTWWRGSMARARTRPRRCVDRTEAAEALLGNPERDRLCGREPR